MGRSLERARAGNEKGPIFDHLGKKVAEPIKQQGFKPLDLLQAWHGCRRGMDGTVPQRGVSTAPKRQGAAPKRHYHVPPRRGHRPEGFERSF